MADFDITVDTRPMADSLDSVNSSVRGVTTSVVAMQSAVVLAQEEASANICRNVDKGFFVLLKSQFDQKIAGVSSKMLSTMQLMETFKGDIDKIMAVMQDDYERIKLRYMKHFSALDKAGAVIFAFPNSISDTETGQAEAQHCYQSFNRQHKQPSFRLDGLTAIASW